MSSAIRGLPGYTGISLADPDGPIDVYGTREGLPRLIEAAGMAAPEAAVRGHAVANDLATLLKVQAAIAADPDFFQRSDLHLYAWWPDMTTGFETVQLVDASPSQLALVEERFGSNLVRAVSVSNPPPIVLIADVAAR